MLEKFFLRRPVQADAEQVLDLMLRCDVRDVGFADSDMEDLVHDWQQCNPAQDAWLAINASGQIQGYGAVLPWSDGKRLAIYDDPGSEHSDLFMGLLILCEKRGVSMLQETAEASKNLVVTHVSASSDYQIKILEEAGYSQARFIFNMHMDLDQSLPEISLPQGVSLRTAVPGQDDRVLYELIEDAFDWRERQPQTFEEWRTFMLRPEIFDPNLWLLAEHEKQVIGACLCFAYNEMGWVRQLAVKKSWRGKSIGRALLLQVFQEFKQRGFPKVGLAVESSNPDACRFYERSGMAKAVHLIEYAKPVSLGPSSESPPSS